ncbi:uncharacterized protein EHS24_005027 [Apiotrichum porosum]|uniref:MAPEG family protein n=1 Tax=Apiotrichum porosum TaxID=105984 RepID=A0A427Y6P2_9TREE|nr:uncharacterized protein EHS24_005027 [Apiotrichum porosum]RSH86755.1 hypothetical protein EHS24_005027 [Apiotrichum porosum]
MIVGLDTATNFSFYAIPAAWVLAIAPHFYAVGLLNLKHGADKPGFDFSNPKKSRERIGLTGLNAEQQGQYLRAEQANDNGFLGLPFFACAILAGNLARLPAHQLNSAAAFYLGTRVAFNLLYVFGNNSSFSVLNLFIQAGKVLQYTDIAVTVA